MATTKQETDGDGWPIRLVHPAATDAACERAAPAVLVATWLIADLADSPGVEVDRVGANEVHLRLVDRIADAQAMHLRIGALLADDRLAGWTAVR